MLRLATGLDDTGCGILVFGGICTSGAVGARAGKHAGAVLLVGLSFRLWAGLFLNHPSPPQTED